MNTYMVEISEMNGDVIASQEFSQFETSAPIPIPNVGDRIYLPHGCGTDGRQAQEVKVSKRLFTYTPENSDDVCVHIQLFCEPTSGS